MSDGRNSLLLKRRRSTLRDALLGVRDVLKAMLILGNLFSKALHRLYRRRTTYKNPPNPMEQRCALQIILQQIIQTS